MKKHILFAIAFIAIFANQARAQFNECEGEIITSFSGGRSFDFFYQNSGLAHPDTWIWDYGDGVVESAQFASHTYAGPGGYSVTCTAISSADSCSFTAQDSVFIQGVGNCQGEVLIFRQGNYFTAVANRTGGSNTATYLWTTPLGATYYADNTIQTLIPDTLLADTLTWCVEMADHWVSGCVVNACTRVSPGAVLPSPLCQARFTIVADTARGGRNYLLLNQSTGSGLAYTWTFGDGTLSHDPAPTHTYADTGIYIICLSISDSAGNCTSSFCDSSMMVAKRAASAVTIRVVPAMPAGTKSTMRNGIEVWPVPAREALHLSEPARNLTLYSLTGQPVLSLKEAASVITVKSLSPGTYLLTGSTAWGTVRKLVVVER